MTKQETPTSTSNVKGAIDSITGLAKAVPIYNDVAQPAAKEVGRSLELIAKSINVALAPISCMVWGYDQLKEFLSTRVAEKMQHVPKDHIVTPPSLVVGPALEALKYAGQEEALREAYANLLANALDSKTSHQVHPSYVEIIRQLSPVEARILSSFTSEQINNGTCLSEVISHTKYKQPTRKFYRQEQAVHEEYTEILRESFLNKYQNYQFENNILAQAFDNLLRLRILEMQVKSAIESNPINETTNYRFNLVLTELGKGFIKLCAIDKAEQI